MRPQRKPFIVEIKKAKQFCRKPAATAGNRTDVVAKAEAKSAVRGEGRS